MSDAKINIEVVCEQHPTQKLDVASEHSSGIYTFRLVVSPCNLCVDEATPNTPDPRYVIKSAELVFNESNLTSQTIEV